jgi:purine-binding chemotaxis protein CheW
MPSRARPSAAAVNWDDLRRRLARVQAVLDGRVRYSPERSREILEARARELARPPAAAVFADAAPIVVFTLGDEKYALEARHVREVVRLSEYTPLPGAPAVLVGVVNLRGDILAVFDLRSFLGAAARDRGEQARVLVMGGDRAEFGVLADAADEVRLLRLDEVLPPPATNAGARSGYIRGVTREALIVIDGAALLRDERLFVDQDEAALR